MAFIMDKQTFADLEILEGKRNVANFFDKPISYGGRNELLNMFNCPLSDINKIRERQEAIRYIYNKKLSIPIDPFLLDFIETYLLLGNKPVKVSHFNAWHKALKYWIQPTNEYHLIKKGIKYIITLLQELYLFATENSEQNHPVLLEHHYNFIAENIRNTELSRIIGVNTTNKINAMDRERFDYIFRFSEYDRVKKILKILYQMDAFQAVADTSAKLGLVFPEITENKTVKITGLYHPLVKDAVTNDVRLNENENMLFLTGANMSGKSTFLKAFGIAVYLAHLGFPVAAASMQTGIFNGLFSTINIADNLNKGYSHFYSEVLRVKSVAKEINKTGNLVVIFDELFRGTNVKDAFDASLAIISAFAKVKGSVFLISTHIMEVADQLRKTESICFKYFHTTIDGKTPIYSYRLRDGVTDERLGMLIIENERIVEIINSHCANPRF